MNSIIYVDIVAHRGASGLVKVENTLDSFEKAIEVGSDMVEFDVRKTSDDILVVYHDKHLADYPIKLTAYDELEAEANKQGFHLPIFKEVLELCDGRIFMDIEIKEHGFEKLLVRDLHKYSDTKHYSIKSFKDNVPYAIKKLDSDITTGLLLGYEKANLKRRVNELFPEKRLEMCKADFVSPNYRLLRFDFIKRMKNLGYPIYVWTVNDTELMHKLIESGIDGIITDRPDLGIKVKRKMAKIVDNS